MTPVSAFIAAMIASFLLGNLSDGRQARIGLAIVVCGAVIVVDNQPGHTRGELIFIPMLFAIAWGAGLRPAGTRRACRGGGTARGPRRARA